MRRAVGVLMATALLAPAAVRASCDGGQLPPRLERLAVSTPRLVALFDYMRHVAPKAVPSQRLAARCRQRLEAAITACLAGQALPAIGCSAIFARTAGALARLAHPADPSRAPFAAAAEAVGEAGVLLRDANRRAGTTCRCDPPLPSAADVPAVGAPVADGMALRVEPVVALAPGTAYRLVVGPPLHALLAGSSPVRLDAGSASDPRWLAGPMAAGDRRFARRVLASARRSGGATVKPSILLCFPRSLALREVAAAQLRFVPAEPDAPDVVLRTAGTQASADGARARAAAERTSSGGAAAIGAVEAEALGLGAARLPHVAEVRRGRFASLDVRSGAPMDVTYLLSLPRGDVPSPVVILLHSLESTARAAMLAHADGLAALGVAAAAFDLPGHGARGEPVPFLDALDPERVAAGFRQAAVDAVALAAALRTRRIAPERIRGEGIGLLGYSLGAMVGAAVLAAEPALGAAVLVAPTGDLGGWLGLTVWKELQSAARLERPGADEGPATASDSVAENAECMRDIVDPAGLRPAQLMTAYRTVLAEVDPQALAPLAVGAARGRPILVQEGGRDEVVTNANTEQLAAALGADMRCRRRARAPQTLCRFPALGHDLVADPVVRMQAHRFLASGGDELVGDSALAVR